MSVASRSADGWIAKAAWWWEHGKLREDFVQQMVPYRPGEDARTFNRIWQLGAEAAIAARRLNQQGAASNATVAGIPNPGGAGRGYRYVIVAGYAGSPGGDTRYVTLSIDSPFQLGMGGLRDQATAAGPGQTASPLSARSGQTAAQTWTLDTVEVRSVERR